MLKDREQDLVERTVRIETLVKEMHDHTFAKGGTLDQYNVRINRLESSQDRVRGVLWIVGVALAILRVHYVTDWLGTVFGKK